MKYFPRSLNSIGRNTKLVGLIFFLMFFAFIFTGYKKAKADNLALESSNAYQQRISKAQNEYKRVTESAIVAQKKHSEDFEKSKKSSESTKSIDI